MNTVEHWKQEKHSLDIIEEIYEYAAEGLSFDEIEERGGEGEWEHFKWAEMYTHDRKEGYFMLRTKVPGGFLTPKQAEVIGDAVMNSRPTASSDSPPT